MTLKPRATLFTLVSCLFSAILPAADTGCPQYPEATFTAHLAELDFERSAEAFAKRQDRRGLTVTLPRANAIDDYLFDKMGRDGVAPAPVTNDLEFMRRVHLDVTGRLPSPEAIEAFSANTAANKRSTLIESLLQSPEFTDYWTNYFAKRFEVTSSYYNEIPVDARNLFHFWLRESIQADKPYNQMAREMLGGSGQSNRNATVNFLVRGWQDGDPIQDTWDTLTDRVTVRFLGMKTECISCHDGRRHLEGINLYLTPKKRPEFWQMSAFFSRMSLLRIGTDVFNQGIVWNLSDRRTGLYHSTVSQTNPGPRPARFGVWEPRFLLSGAEPETGNWREEFARILTEDRQFAKAAVNYIWAHFFRRGIVDPPDAWDLRRTDPANPPPSGWPMQSSHPELLEHLADFYIQNGYRLKPLIRLITSSTGYQLASRYEGQWKPQYAWYFAKQTPRRLTAEEAYDALVTATETQVPMQIHGFPEPLLYASQLPDATEPRGDGNIRNFLTQLGRGDWWTIPNRTTPSLLQVLYMMNDYMNVSRSLTTGAQGSNTRAGRLVQSSMTEEQVVRQLFLASLSRPPSADELAVLAKARKGNRDQWISDVQWILLNKLDFIFNY
jgi:hypothetical protein